MSSKEVIESARSENEVEDPKGSMNRRTFLRGVGLGSGAAGAAGVLAATGLGPADAAPTQGKRDDRKLGYEKTEHMRRYYESTRF